MDKLYNISGDELDLTPELYNPLYGKKWSVCGDSFTDGATDTVLPDGKYVGYKAVYPYIIGNRNNMNIVSFFRGGQTLAYPSDGTFHNSLTDPTSPNFYQKIPSDTDYITIYLGINDSHYENSDTGGIPLGTIDDADASTYYGAWNTVLTWLIANRPFSHTGIIVSNGCDREAHRTAQIEIAKKFGIPYIDMNGDHRTPTMIRSKNPDVSSTIKEIIKQNQAVDPDGTKTGTVNTHPNDSAHKYESYFIEDFLRSI